MEKYNGSLIRKFPGNVSGNAYVGASITVYIAGTSGKAILYAANDVGGAQLDNPLTSDDNGNYSFYATNGRYRLEFGTGQPDLEVLLLDGDLSDAQEAAADAAASAAAAAISADAAEDAAAIAILYPEGQFAAYTALIAKIKSKATLITDFVRNEFKVYEPPYGQESKQLTDLITNTRATNATRNTPLGVETVVANVLRIEYDGSTGEPLGALCEPLGANLLLWSEQLDNAAWSKVSTTVATNSAPSPDVARSTVAEKLIMNTGAQFGTVRQVFTAADNAIVTLSVYFMEAEWNSIRMAVLNRANAVSLISTYNAQTGAISGTGASASTLKQISDGWWRASLTVSVGAGISTPQILIYPVNNSDNASTGDGVSGVFIYGAQVTQSPYLTSYVKTEAATVTRITDATRSQFLSRFLNDNFSFMADVTPTGIGSDGTNRLIAFAASDAAAGDQIGVVIDNAGARLRFLSSAISGGATSWTPVDPATLAGRLRIVGTVNKTAGAVKLWVNGALVINTSTTITSNIAAFRFVKYGIATVALGNMGKQLYREVDVYPTALSDVEALTLSGV